MDLNRFTEQSQEALRRAQELAVRRNHQGIDAAHLLAALLEETDGLAAGCLAAAGIAPSAVRERIDQELNAMPQVSGPGMEAQQVYFTQGLARLLTQSEDEARALKDEYVSVEHLLLAMIADERSAVARLLRPLGLTRERLLAAIRKIRGSQRVTSPNPEATDQALERYGRDLTKLAGQGKLDPVIGRDDEIRRIVQVLSRRTKNNPVGLPAIYTRVITMYSLPTSAYYAYLGLYNLAYVADDSVMLTVAVVTLSREKLQEKGARWLKLVSGVVMLGLGVILMLRPELLAN